MFQYEMNEAKVKLRRVKAADVTQLDRPSPKDRFETKNFQKLIKSYIQNNSTNDNRDVIYSVQLGFAEAVEEHLKSKIELPIIIN